MPDRDVAWIAADRCPFSDHTVGSLVPVGFEAYARVLHPAWAATGVPVRWDTVATWAGRHVHPLAQWDFLSRPRDDPPAPAPFVAQPDTNGLPPGHLAVLGELLATHTRTPERCFVGVWDGYGWTAADSEWAASPVLRADQRTFLVREGPLGLALEVGRGASDRPDRASPSIFWPSDRAWLVASDPDLDSTYLGGTGALIEAVLAHPALEAWPAAARTWSPSAATGSTPDRTPSAPGDATDAGRDAGR